MHKPKNHFFYGMILLNVIANVSIITDVAYGENSKLSFNFSSFLTTLIFILLAQKIYNAVVSSKSKTE